MAFPKKEPNNDRSLFCNRKLQRLDAGAHTPVLRFRFRTAGVISDVPALGEQAQGLLARFHQGHALGKRAVLEGAILNSSSREDCFQRCRALIERLPVNHK
eukprot:TRINITY_DN6178_c0_g1_i1.p4 TRINITY_DN6178_c0_g1~~TRINITY_DN6178_c0_g1_i1.p4  ORF type:complete len:114 (-),score=20.06 TRINITY_DN6178_c0_g1_i1:640-942(-)